MSDLGQRYVMDGRLLKAIITEYALMIYFLLLRPMTACEVFIWMVFIVEAFLHGLLLFGFIRLEFACFFNCGLSYR